MKKILSLLFLMLLFNITISGVLADTNEDLTKEEIKTWGENMVKDSNNKYAAFCIYSYENSSCSSNWNSDECKRYVYAIGVPITDDKGSSNPKVEYYPIAQKGDFVLKKGEPNNPNPEAVKDFYGQDNMSRFSKSWLGGFTPSKTTIAPLKYVDNTFQECAASLDKEDFKTNSGYKCINIDWSKEGKYCGGLHLEYPMSIGSSTNPVIDNAKTSANVYSYTNSSLNESDKVDESKRHICVYNNLQITYDENKIEDPKWDIEWFENKENSSLGFIQNYDLGLKNEYFKTDNGGKLSCPLMICKKVSTPVPGTGQIVYTIQGEVVTKEEYMEKNSKDNLCILENDGSSVAELEKVDIDTYTPGGEYILNNPDLDIDDSVGTCSEILGPNLTKLLKAAVRIVQIGGVIATIVNAMISLIPAITSKDQEGLKKAVRKCIYMAIVLVLLLLLGTIIKLIGMIFGFDTSCFV